MTAERPDGAGWAELLADAAARAAAYLEGLEGRPVTPSASALDGLARFDRPLPDGPGDPAATLALLDEAGSGATVASAGGRYFGFVTGSATPAALAASWMTSAWDQNAALPVMSPVADALHSVVSAWITDLLRLPAGTAVAFTTGATLANATALAAARDAQLASAGWDAPADGLFGAPPVTVVVGEKAHSTLFKGLSMVGLGRSRVVVVPADSQGRLRAEQLPTGVTGPVIVCAQAGEVNTGAFDPFAAIADWAGERGAWVHVDGAFGLWALVDPDLDAVTAGLDRADSWATDGHKWLNVTYDCGIVAVRRPGDLQRSFASSAGYLPAGGGFEAMHHTPQSSQRARQIEVWAVLHSLGRRGVTDLVRRCCSLARRFAGQLEVAGLEVVNEVVLNQVLVRAGSDEETSALVQAVQAEGTCWCGPTLWEGRPAMRISVSSWATTEADIDLSAAAVLAAYRGLAGA